MSFIKYSQGEITHIVEGKDELDDEKAKRALKEAKQASKNIDKDGNKSSFNTESSQ